MFTSTLVIDVNWIRLQCCNAWCAWVTDISVMLIMFSTPRSCSGVYVSVSLDYWDVGTKPSWISVKIEFLVVMTGWFVFFRFCEKRLRKWVTDCLAVTLYWLNLIVTFQVTCFLPNCSVKLIANINEYMQRYTITVPLNTIYVALLCINLSM